MDKKSKNTEKNTSKIKKPFKTKSLKKADTKIVDANTTTKNGKGKKKNRKTGWKIFRICLFVFLALCIIGGGIVIGVVANIISKTDTVALEELTKNLTTIIYDKDGNQIASLHGGENRISVEAKDIPENLKNAVISIEDERFYDHNGVDIKRTLGAIVTYVLHGGNSSFGGSTITQQLVKNIKDDDDKSWTRKIREWYRAILLEQKLDKDEILAEYLNTIYLGEGSYGIEVASQKFFGKHAKDLSLAESAIIAAQIQSPEATNPYKSEEAKEKLLTRQKVVLNKMLELGKIDQTEYDEAVKQEIAFTKADLQSASGNINSYFVDAVIEMVLEDLKNEKGVDKGVALQMLYTGGYKIYTTFDPKVQKAIDDAYNNDKIFYTDRAGTFMQSSMVVLDQTNGNILGLIGGAGQKTVNRGLNRAIGSADGSGYRQLGSCMKPFGAYGPAFESGVLSPGTTLDDSQLTLPGFAPHNYYGYYFGYVTARQAIAYSMNIPAVRAYLLNDVDFAYNFAKNCGINVVPADKVPGALALGGLSEGVTALQAANAYATIANSGVHTEPRIYTKILDSNDKEFIVKNVEAKRVMKDSTAYMLTSCLQSVTQAGNPNGTAYGHVKVGNIAVAGKTGNTNDDYDQWFCGFTPYYTIACWNGYDTPKSINRAYPYASMRLFNTVMNAICSGLPAKDFDKPNNIINASVCSVSGLVATDACRADPRGDRTRSDIFASGTVPTKTCDIHKMAKICKDTGKLATEFCPNTEERSFITRDNVNIVKTSDWAYMMPTETCDVHTSKPIEPEEPEDPDGNIDVYGDKKKK